jgi:hypothetical protein
MKRIDHNEKTLLIMTLAIGCMALVLLWPQWRDELRAQQYEEPQAILVFPVCCLYSCPASPEQEKACSESSRRGRCLLPPMTVGVPSTAGGCSPVAGCDFINVIMGSCFSD